MTHRARPASVHRVAKKLVLLLRGISPVPEHCAKARKRARMAILCLQVAFGAPAPYADNFSRAGERPPGLHTPCLLLSSWAGMSTAQVNKTAAKVCARAARLRSSWAYHGARSSPQPGVAHQREVHSL